MARSAWLVTVAMVLGGCGADLGGTWFGRIDCEGVDYEVDLVITPVDRETYSGEGTWTRQTTDPETSNPVEVVEGFSVTLVLDDEGGDALETEMSCTSYTTINYLAGFREPDEVEGTCQEGRFSEIAMSRPRDGGDITVSGEDCSGTLEKTSR